MKTVIIGSPAKRFPRVYFQGGLIIKPTKAFSPLKLGTFRIVYFHDQLANPKIRRNMKKYISVKLQTRNNRPLSDTAMIERAWSLMNESMRAIDLQRRRLRSSEPEDADFIFRWWVDLQFLIVALRRLRRSAELATRVSTAKSIIADAIEQFDRELPMLQKMRNVGEHIDDYAVDSEKRRHKDVERFSLQVNG